MSEDDDKDLEHQIYEQFRNGLTLCDAALLQDAIGAMIQVAITEALEQLCDKLEQVKS